MAGSQSKIGFYEEIAPNIEGNSVSQCWLSWYQTFNFETLALTAGFAGEGDDNIMSRLYYLLVCSEAWWAPRWLNCAACWFNSHHK